MDGDGGRRLTSLQKTNQSSDSEIADPAARLHVPLFLQRDHKQIVLSVVFVARVALPVAVDVSGSVGLRVALAAVSIDHEERVESSSVSLRQQEQLEEADAGHQIRRKRDLQASNASETSVSGQRSF